MEAAESPLDVLSRAAVMIQRNVLPPPSYGRNGVCIILHVTWVQRIISLQSVETQELSSLCPSTSYIFSRGLYVPLNSRNLLLFVF